MNNENMAVYPPYRLVAQFADGARLLFDGLTEAQAQQSMEAAQAQHGDIAWYDGVTDLHYENGKYYKLIQTPNGAVLFGSGTKRLDTLSPSSPPKPCCPFRR